MGLEHKPEFNKKKDVQQGSFENTPGFLPKEQTEAEKQLIEKIKNFAKEYDIDVNRVTVGTEGDFLIDGRTLTLYLKDNFVNDEENKAEEDLKERMKNFAEKYSVDERAISIGSDGSFLIYGQPPPKHLEEKNLDNTDIDNLYSDSEEYKRKHPFDR